MDGALFRMRRDEFAVIVAAGTADPVRLAERLVAVVAEPTELRVDGRVVIVAVTACAGIAVTTAGAGGARIVLAHADTALRHAKSVGRGRIASITDAVRRDGPGPRPPTQPR
jgi:GGDEF domain-containing protein